MQGRDLHGLPGRAGDGETPLTFADQKCRMVSPTIHRFDAAVSCACVALLAFFAWHAWKGPRGYAYSDGLDVKLAGLQVELGELKQKRAALEGRTALMRPEHVDPDLLRELARTELGMVSPNDLVIQDQP